MMITKKDVFEFLKTENLNKEFLHDLTTWS